MATDLTYNDIAVTVVSRINTAITEQNKGVAPLDANSNASTVISRVNAAIAAESNDQLVDVSSSDNAVDFIDKVNALFASIRNGGGQPQPTYPDAPSILILGNSFTQDSWSYVPYLLKEYGINIKVGIYYRASNSLGGLVDEFSAGIPNPPNDYNCGFYYFDTARQSGWEERYNRPLAENCVKYYDGMENDTEIDESKTGLLWDIIVFQQVSSLSFYHEAYGSAIQELKTLVAGEMNKVFSYGFNLTHSKGGPETDLPLDIIDSIHNACINHNIGIVFPYGTAIYNGRNIPELKVIGSSAGGDNLWNSDYQHLIGGIPYYLASLAIVETIFRLYYSETDLTIDGNTTMPTSSWLSSKSMPGGRGKPTSGVNIDFTKVTAANCALAQQAALDACDDNWNIEGGWPYTIVLKLTNCSIENDGGYAIERVGTTINPSTYYFHVPSGATVNGITIKADSGYSFGRASLRSWRRTNYRNTDSVPSGSSGNITASGTDTQPLDGFTPSGSILMTISPIQSQ